MEYGLKWLLSSKVLFLLLFFTRKYMVSCRENVGVNQKSLGPFFSSTSPLHFLSSRLYYSKVVTSTMSANINIIFCFSHYSCWQTQKQISRGLQISCRSCQLSKNTFQVWKRRWSTLKTSMRWALDGKWSKIVSITCRCYINLFSSTGKVPHTLYYWMSVMLTLYRQNITFTVLMINIT